MKGEPLRLLVLGAHPDDAEFHCGGLAARWCRLGRQVRMVSVTDGRCGHHQIPPEQLVAVRRREAGEAAGRIGAQWEVWDFPDGALQPTLDVRHRIIREIRSYRPDLVITHRPWDYHPDHRAVGQAVQDACYLVTVPHVLPEVPALRRDPVVACMVDLFTRPCPMSPDVIVDVEQEAEAILGMLACHQSQFFQWLPYNQGLEAEVPEDTDGRMAFLRTWYGRQMQRRVEHFRQALVEHFGSAQADRIKWIEVYEISQYGAPLDATRRKVLFPCE